jgi:general stress protein YciG
MARIEKSARDAAREYLAQIGAKGGKATGEAKARDPAHYKRLADMKRAAARARTKGKRA